MGAQKGLIGRLVTAFVQTDWQVFVRAGDVGIQQQESRRFIQVHDLQAKHNTAPSLRGRETGSGADTASCTTDCGCKDGSLAGGLVQLVRGNRGRPTFR